MKKILISLVLVLGVAAVPISAYAQEDSAEQTVEAVEPTTQPVVDETTASNGNGQGAEKRAERVQNYKERLAEKLTFAEERKIKGSCKGAQTVVLRLSENAGQVKQIRENAYGSISEKLERLVGKLDAAGVDSSTLSDALASMEAEVDIFLATMTDYETILIDLGEMDCETDPEAFKAALSAAKQQRVTLVSSSQGLRNYFNESIKPILQQIRAELTTGTEGEE